MNHDLVSADTLSTPTTKRLAFTVPTSTAMLTCKVSNRVALMHLAGCPRTLQQSRCLLSRELSQNLLVEVWLNLLVNCGLTETVLYKPIIYICYERPVGKVWLTSNEEAPQHNQICAGACNCGTVWVTEKNHYVSLDFISACRCSQIKLWRVCGLRFI